jgi:hypothetical protein
VTTGTIKINNRKLPRVFGVFGTENKLYKRNYDTQEKEIDPGLQGDRNLGMAYSEPTERGKASLK